MSKVGSHHQYFGLTDGINDNTIHWTLYMTSVEEATADYQVKSTFVYDENSDGLTMRLWMERRGKLVLNAVDNINKLGGAQVQIFDTNTTVPIYTLSTAAGTMSGISSNDTTSSVFLEQLAKVTSPTSPVVLMPGKTYFAQCGIYYGDPNSPPLKYYQTGTTFTITTNEAVKQIQAMSTQIQSEVSGVKTQVATESATIQGKVAEVQGQTGQILTATQTTLPQQITAKTSEVKTEVTTAAKSAILNRENTVMLGSSLLIRYRTYEGAAPVISVYDPKGVARIASAPMKASTAPGIYEYSVLFTAGWPQGDYSVVCSEPTYDTMDAITITARTTDIANISSDVSAVLGSVSPIKDIKAQVESFSAAFNVIEDNIRKASEVMASIKAGTTDMSDVTDRMTSLFNTLKEMSTKIKEIGAGVGGDIEKLYEVSESKSKDINYIRNKTQELKALMLMSQQMMESTAKEEPVVQTWFEYR